MDEYCFHPDQLAPESRAPGISAIMRLRNSEDFLEAVVESHAPYFDEIVAVYNQCTDATPAILAALDERFPGKLKITHYEPRVFPSGTPEHIAEPADSPHSLVNYSNFALAQSTHRIVALLDDDHIAVERNVARLTEAIRRKGSLKGAMWCISGLNLDRHRDGTLGVHLAAPFAGNGDHGYFEVTRKTYFEHGRKFERLRYEEFQRRYHGMAYWHLKYLKRGFGFANYELDENPHSRYSRHRERFLGRRDTASLETFLGRHRPCGSLARLLSAVPLPERLRLRLARYSSLAQEIVAEDLTALRARALQVDRQTVNEPL